MTLQERISALAETGRRIKVKLMEGSMSGVMDAACAENRWFTRENIGYALNAVCSDMLDGDKLRCWTGPYNLADRAQAANIGIVMAGNIPLVGFFDLLCVLVTGNAAFIKPSSKDTVLMDYMMESLLKASPEFGIAPLTGMSAPDAVIATGGEQANMHFKAGFAGIPAIFRGDRTSVAVLDGSESDEQLKRLSDDVFLYLGLGCRNVSRIFVPAGYDLQHLVDILGRCRITHPSYMNEYRQNRALLTMQGRNFTDGGFFTLTESDLSAVAGSATRLSDISVVRYSAKNEMNKWLSDNENRIQCVVASDDRCLRRIDFGLSQHPSLTDYPDGVDVIRFLMRL